MEGVYVVVGNTVTLTTTKMMGKELPKSDTGGGQPQRTAELSPDGKTLTFHSDAAIGSPIRSKDVTLVRVASQ